MTKLIATLCVTWFATSTLAIEPQRTASSTVDSFEKIFGVTKGKRRNHTKGFCFEGKLEPQDLTIQEYTHSPLFNKTSNVIGRLSHKGGNSVAADNKPGEHGMGLSISTADGSTHRMSMNTLDFFPVATPEAFAELMQAKSIGGEAVKAFKQKSPDLQRFKAHMSNKTKKLLPFEGMAFNSINSFYLVNDSEKHTAVRWSFVPSKPQAIVSTPKQDFFYDNMQRNLRSHGIAWDMVITLANADDKVNNAALPWSGKHRQIVAAKLKVHSISTEKDGQCDAINFDPLVLSPGFKPSADPLLQARRSSYAISFGKRMSEKQQQN